MGRCVLEDDQRNFDIQIAAGDVDVFPGTIIGLIGIDPCIKIHIVWLHLGRERQRKRDHVLTERTTDGRKRNGDTLPATCNLLTKVFNYRM